MKIPKHLEKRNFWTFYIPADFMPVWIRFLEEIHDDKRLRAKQDPKNANKIISLGLRIAIKSYLRFKNMERTKEIKESKIETPN